MPHERQQYGRYGENRAADFLVERGYRIIETNYKNRFGEIDLIAVDGETIVFVEVKSRRTGRFGSARDAVPKAKQRRISKVALGYLKSNGGTRQKARFDVIALDAGAAGCEDRIEIIKNAFYLAYG